MSNALAKETRRLQRLIRMIGRSVLSSARAENGLLEHPYSAGEELSNAVQAVESAALEDLYQKLQRRELPQHELNLDPLLSWFTLDAESPSLVDVYSIPMAGTDMALLAVIVTHPFAPNAIIYGVLPRPKSPELSEQWCSALYALFEANGGGETVLVSSVPDAVGLQPSSGVSGALARELFWRAITAESPKLFISDYDVRSKIAQIIKTWQNAGQEFLGGLDSIAVNRHPIVRGQRSRRRKPKRETFEIWWFLASNPSRAQAITSAFWEVFRLVQLRMEILSEN